ncbi:hypothetical protein RHGRI_022602 [Rhododendron griersonianum]|uniref:Uncharacterized protein n=1 Tax=Rhododendron griersonianum TaxID=479676 RepID=A0AAV6J2N2_9ERIC|nr:hypothetical protein RHGRI_022602 [Rhododendron griersonianum]
MRSLFSLASLPHSLDKRVPKKNSNRSVVAQLCHKVIQPWHFLLSYICGKPSLSKFTRDEPSLCPYVGARFDLTGGPHDSA